MAEEAIPSAADPLRVRIPSTRLPSLAELYAAQQLGQSLQANSYTLPELYALEQTGTPLDLTPAPGTGSPQQSQSLAPQDQSLPILADQREANEGVLRRKESDREYADLLQQLGINLERNLWGRAPARPPKGWTWHHHPHEEGLVQLMPRSQHEASELQALLHPFKYGAGGFARWGHKYVIPGASTGAIWSMQRPDTQTDDNSNSQQQPDELY